MRISSSLRLSSLLRCFPCHVLVSPYSCANLIVLIVDRFSERLPVCSLSFLHQLYFHECRRENHRHIVGSRAACSLGPGGQLPPSSTAFVSELCRRSSSLFPWPFSWLGRWRS